MGASCNCEQWDRHSTLTHNTHKALPRTNRLHETHGSRYRLYDMVSYQLLWNPTSTSRTHHAARWCCSMVSGQPIYKQDSTHSTVRSSCRLPNVCSNLRLCTWCTPLCPSDPRSRVLD